MAPRFSMMGVLRPGAPRERGVDRSDALSNCRRRPGLSGRERLLNLLARDVLRVNLCMVVGRVLFLVLAMASRAAFFSAVSGNAGQAMLKLNNWAVVGDVTNPSKPASRVVSSLKEAGKTVHLVNPRKPELHASVADASTAAESPIDVVDLCINHIEGLKQVTMCKELGINKVFIQPGAESPDILKFCQESGIEVFQGCVMVELGAAH